MLKWLIVVLCVSGCVSKSKHEATAAKLKACQEDARSQANRCDSRESELKGELAASAEELAELRAQKKSQAKELESFRRFVAKLQKMIDVGEIKVYVRRGRLMVGLASKVLFPSGKHELSKRGKQTLARVAKALAEIPERRFLVAGHTDNQGIGKKLIEEYQDNWDLSAARALTVTRYLIEKGVPAKGLAMAGYSQFDPVRSNRTRGGRRLNRRIELIVEPNIAQLPKIPKELGAAEEAAPPE